MASSDKQPAPVAAKREAGQPPGKPVTAMQKMMEKGSQILQSMKPLKQMRQHVSTFALYSHDLGRQMETRHYISRLNQDFLRAAVYDSDDSNARLIGSYVVAELNPSFTDSEELLTLSGLLWVIVRTGIEYIVSDRIFEALSAEEQKLWHSHAHEVKSGLWVNPRIPEFLAKPELDDMAKTYGKFWCTWQLDRGDKLPLGAPALMMSPQAESPGRVKAELVGRRDEKYKISTLISTSRMDIEEPENENSGAD